MQHSLLDVSDHDLSDDVRLELANKQPINNYKRRRAEFCSPWPSPPAVLSFRPCLFGTPRSTWFRSAKTSHQILSCHAAGCLLPGPMPQSKHSPPPAQRLGLGKTSLTVGSCIYAFLLRSRRAGVSSAKSLGHQPSACEATGSKAVPDGETPPQKGGSAVLVLGRNIMLISVWQLTSNWSRRGLTTLQPGTCYQTVSGFWLFCRPIFLTFP